MVWEKTGSNHNCIKIIHFQATKLKTKIKKKNNHRTTTYTNTMIQLVLEIVTAELLKSSHHAEDKDQE
jgi:hypothetical protein